MWDQSEFWDQRDNALHATFEFKDFVEAFSFMTSVAIIAEKQNHHPEWSNVWNKVVMKLSTHDAGNIVTHKDHTLAKAVEEIYSKYR